MATGKEKFQLIFEAQENASQKIAQLNKQLANLGGPAMVKSQNEIKKLERQISLLSGGTKKGSILFSRFTQGIAAGNIIANLAIRAFTELKNAVLGTIGAAAESEKVWAQVNKTLERNNLLTDHNIERIKQFTNAMQTLTGVSDEELAQSLNTLIDRGVSLTQAFQLVSAAADIATSKNKEMSRTINELADAVGRGDFSLLEKYGITVDKSADKTSQLQSAIQQLNQDFGGAAAAAADTYAVRIEVMKQKFNDLQETVGGLATPVLLEFANTAIAFIDELQKVGFGEKFSSETTKTLSASDRIISSLKNIQSHMTGWVEITVGGVRIIANAFQIAMDAIEVALSPVVDISNAWIMVLKGDFRAAGDTLKNVLNNMATESKDVNAEISDLADSFKLLSKGINDVNSAGAATPESIAGSVEDARKVVASALAGIPPALDESEEEFNEYMRSTTTVIQGSSEQFAVGLTRMMAKQNEEIAGFVANMSVDLAQGRTSIKQIWVGMANDFMRFFIQKALATIVNTFIPGLGGLLGSIFDTPANDRMAAQQGRDFMTYFTKGALAQAQGGTELATSLTGNNNRIAPAAMTGGGTGGSSGGAGIIVMNVNVSGNVMSDAFVEKNVAPTLLKLIRGGRSLLAEQPEHSTGRRHVLN